MSTLSHEQPITSASERHIFDRSDILDALAIVPMKTEDFIVIGGANLVLRKVRELTSDIDLLVTHEGFTAMVHTLGTQLKDPPQSALAWGAKKRAVVLKQGSRPEISATEEMGDRYTMTYETARPTAVKIGGLLCQSIDQIIQSKTAIARPVDIDDLKLLETHLNTQLHIPAVPLRIPDNS